MTKRLLNAERRTGGRRLGWLSIIGVLIIPLLVAGGFLAATWNSTSRLGKIQAAIVNQDKPVKIDGEQVPLGRQLAGGLVEGDDSRSGENFDWVISDSSDAADGLDSGHYAAVVTIPSSFSADATSPSKNDGERAERAEVEVQTSKASGITDSAVARSISTAAIGSINDQLGRQYLSNLYVGFNQVQSGVEKSADGAGKLADSSGRLSSGLHNSTKGAQKLSAGSDQLSDGAGKLSTGIGKLEPGAKQLANGANSLNRGAGQLNGGLNQLADNTKQLPKQSKQLDHGVRGAAGGARKLSGGIGKIEKSANQLDKGASRLESGLNSYANTTRQNAAGVKKYVNGVKKYTGSVGPYAKNVGQYADGVSSYTSGVQQAGNELKTAGQQISCPQDMSADECQAYKKGAAAVGQQANQTLTSGKLGNAGNQLAGTSTKIKSGSRQLTNSSADLDRSGDQLSNGAAKLHTGATTLKSSAGELSTGAGKLSTGAGNLDSSAGKLAGSLDQLANGTHKLARSAPKLHRGIAQSADASKKLGTGARRVSNGARHLSSGIGKLDKAGDSVARGAKKSATATQQLANGLTKLDKGGNQLAHGASKLHKGLQDSAEKMPSYSSADRKQLSKVAAQPVSTPQPHGLFANQSTTTLLMAIALWIGGLVTYLVIRPIPSYTFTSSRSSLRLALEGIAPGAAIGAIQAVVLASVLSGLLQLSAGQFGGLLGFGVFAGVTFAVVNHALAALLQGLGRLLSATAVVLSAAGGLTTALPSFFAVTRPFLPVTPALDGMRSLVTHGPSIGSQVAILLSWLVIGAAVGLLAVARRRTASRSATEPAPSG